MELSDEEIEDGRNILNSGNEGGYRSDEAEEDPSGQNEDENGEDGKGRRIDPSTSKKKIVRNPQPKLDAERIQGSKGVQTIEKYFEGFKFHGKGHEKADLDRVMKRLEHWAHRLFPKYRFDDFLEKMETLGSKKNVQVFLKKYRLDMIKPDDDIIDLEDENEGTREEQFVPEESPVDEFDKLIAEQIEKQRQVTNEPPKHINKPTGNILGSASTAKPSELSEEVKARIEANKKLAIERKMARLRREEENKKRKLEESQVDSQVSNSIDVSGTNDGSKGVEEVRNKKSATEKVLEEVNSSKIDDKTEDFGRRESNKNTEKETKQKKVLDSLEEEIPIVEVEERMERIQQPIDKQSLSDRPFSGQDHVVDKDIVKVPVYQVEECNLPKVNIQDYVELNKDSDKLLTHEELLMEIDGAMEEIINKSTRRSP